MAPFSSLTSSSSAFRPYARSARYSPSFPSTDARPIVMCTPRISSGTRGIATIFDDSATVRVPAELSSSGEERRTEHAAGSQGQQRRRESGAAKPLAPARLMAPLAEPVAWVDSAMNVHPERLTRYAVLLVYATSCSTESPWLSHLAAADWPAYRARRSARRSRAARRRSARPRGRARRASGSALAPRRARTARRRTS